MLMHADNNGTGRAQKTSSSSTLSAPPQPSSAAGAGPSVPTYTRSSTSPRLMTSFDNNPQQASPAGVNNVAPNTAVARSSSVARSVENVNMMEGNSDEFAKMKGEAEMLPRCASDSALDGISANEAEAASSGCILS